MKRDGFTLIEVLISLVVLGMVISTTLAFLDTQNRAFAAGVERAEVMRNLQHVTGNLRRDLRPTGTNLGAGQPFVVYAGADVIAVNADYATNVAGDPFAVYHDPDAPPGTVGALTEANAITLPGTGFVYPDTTYLTGSVVGAAETLIFYFAEDDMSDTEDDYILYRQVNAETPEVVARELVRVNDGPFFEYLSEGPGDRLAAIDSARLPLSHGVPVHLSPCDTMPYALVDSIRAVRVRVGATSVRPGAAAARGMETTIRFPNAGLERERSCGSSPILGQTLSAEGRNVGGVSEAELTWSPAVDELSGERDVIRYVIWKEGPGGGGDEPFVSIPAGSAGYQFIDRGLQQGETYIYRMAAQDCTPSLSPTSAAVVNAP